MDKKIAKDFSKVASEARRKANYLRMRPSDPSCWNYEQQQGAPEALDELAKMIETLVAKHFIHYGLAVDGKIQEDFKHIVSRQIRSTVRREHQKEHASLFRR